MTGPPKKCGPAAADTAARPLDLDPHSHDGSDGAPSEQGKQFIKLPSELLARRGITLTAKVLYSIIVDEMRGTGSVRIGVRRLAGKIGMHGHAVIRAVEKIKEAGLLDVQTPAKTGGRTSYKLPTDRCRNSNGHKKGKRCTNSNGQADPDRCRNSNTTVAETATEALPKQQHVQTQTIFQTLSGHPADGARGAGEAKSEEPAKTKTDATAHRTLVAHWTATWSRLIGGNGKTPFTATDGRHIKTLLAAVAGDVDRAKAIIDRYLTDADPWLSANRPDRPLGTLVSDTRLKKYLAATAAPKTAAAAVPSDAESHPLIIEARRLFGDDVDRNLKEWIHLADAGASYRALKPGVFASGAEARAALRAKINGAIAHAS